MMLEIVEHEAKDVITSLGFKEIHKAQFKMDRAQGKYKDDTLAIYESFEHVRFGVIE